MLGRPLSGKSFPEHSALFADLFWWWKCGLRIGAWRVCPLPLCYSYLFADKVTWKRSVQLLGSTLGTPLSVSADIFLYLPLSEFILILLYFEECKDWTYYCKGSVFCNGKTKAKYSTHSVGIVTNCMVFFFPHIKHSAVFSGIMYKRCWIISPLSPSAPNVSFSFVT